MLADSDGVTQVIITPKLLPSLFDSHAASGDDSIAVHVMMKGRQNLVTLPPCTSMFCVRILEPHVAADSRHVVHRLGAAGVQRAQAAGACARCTQVDSD